MIYNKKDGSYKVSYNASERAEALEVSMTALAARLGYTPVKIGNHYYLREMDSLIIYNDRTWNRWSKKGNITGGTQIDFMLEYGNASDVPEAIRQLLDFKGSGMADAPKYIEDSLDNRHQEPQNMVLPPRNGNQKRLFAYLIKTRCLSPEIVYDFVHRKLIYEDAIHHNIVYCGMDPEGTIRYAGLRGTADAYGKIFKMDVAGNDKNYGVNIVNKDSDEVKVFESVIDCMSYIDLTHDNKSNKLMLGMVEDNPLEQFLKDYNHIKKITFCLDNDVAGQQAIFGNPEAKTEERRNGLKAKYEKRGYDVSVELPEAGKDFNEQLKKTKDKAVVEQQRRVRRGGR